MPAFLRAFFSCDSPLRRPETPQRPPHHASPLALLESLIIELQGPAVLRDRALLHFIGRSVACTLTLGTLARSRAIGALTAITRPLAHRALARSTTHIALHSLFSHYGLYSTVIELSHLQDARSREENWSSARRKWGHRAGRGGHPPGKHLGFAGPPSAEMSLGAAGER